MSLFSAVAHAVLEQLHEGVAVFDADGELLYANPEARSAIEALAVEDENGGLLPVLAKLGARVRPLWNSGRKVGQAVYLSASKPQRSTLAEQERRAILGTLEATGWKLTESARCLGISRTTLWRRLRDYGLRPESRGPRSGRS